MGNHPPDAAEYRDRRIVRVRRQPHAHFLSHLHTYVPHHTKHSLVRNYDSVLRAIEGQVTYSDTILNYCLLSDEEIAMS